MNRGAADGVLPWGWWLRLEGEDFHDGEGGQWRSVRDAFWRGHLCMPDVHYAEEQQELLLRVLASIDARGGFGRTSSIDLFNGDAMMWRFYRCWLWSIGLLETGAGKAMLAPPSPLEAGLSEEGRSVLAMLRLTRRLEWEPLPMREVVEEVTRGDWGEAEQAREDALKAFERAVGRRRWTFARERAGRSHLVTLTGIDAHARMPTLGIMWSLAFPDARPRDDLFAWVAARVDRWDDWGERAYGSGAREFTRHLLMMFVDEMRSLA